MGGKQRTEGREQQKVYGGIKRTEQQAEISLPSPKTNEITSRKELKRSSSV